LESTPVAEPTPLLLVANFADRLGGGEESLLTLARGLDRSRFRLHAVVPGEGAIAETLRRLGIPVAVLPMPPLRLQNLGGFTRALRGLRHQAVAWHIRLIHAHGSRVAVYAGLVARRLGIPLIWHVRIADRDRLLDPVLLRLSTRVIAISQAVKARFAGSRHLGKIQVIYNGVDLPYWSPAERVTASAAGPVVLLVGRLSPEKGQATLLRAAPAVLQKVPGTRFILLGADLDHEGRHLRLLARTLAVEGAVEFREWLGDPRAVFQEADVVVLPSRSEGFGRVLVEAACLGKPVVASRVGGIPEVVVDGVTGLLVPPENPAALAEAVVTLLRDPAIRARLGAAGRERALAHFTASRHVEEVASVYEELAQSDPAGMSAVKPEGPVHRHASGSPAVREMSEHIERENGWPFLVALRGALPGWATGAALVVGLAALAFRGAWPTPLETFTLVGTTFCLLGAWHIRRPAGRVVCAVLWIALLMALGVPTPARSIGFDFRTFYEGAEFLYRRGHSPYSAPGTTAFPFPTFALVWVLSLAGRLPLEWTFLAFVALQAVMLSAGAMLMGRVAAAETASRNSDLGRRLLQAGMVLHPAVLAGMAVGNSAALAGAAVLWAVWLWRCGKGTWSVHGSAILLSLGWMIKPQLIPAALFFLANWWLARTRGQHRHSRAARIGRLLVPWAGALLTVSLVISFPATLLAYREFPAVAVTWHTRIAETYPNNYALAAILAKALARIWAVPISQSLFLLTTGIAAPLLIWNIVSLTGGRPDSLRAFLPWLLISLLWTSLVWEWYFSLVLAGPILMMALTRSASDSSTASGGLRLAGGIACTMVFSSFIFTLGYVLLYCHSQAWRAREKAEIVEGQEGFRGDQA
jgi:glycosyltransferase involved in cell wall biosynthesis